MRVIHLHCPNCGYDLRGRRAATCPECGEPVDRREIASKLRRERLTPLQVLLIGMIPAIILAVAHMPALLLIFLVGGDHWLLSGLILVAISLAFASWFAAPLVGFFTSVETIATLRWICVATRGPRDQKCSTAILVASIGGMQVVFASVVLAVLWSFAKRISY